MAKTPVKKNPVKKTPVKKTPTERTLLVCCGTGCAVNKGREVMEALNRELEALGKKTGKTGVKIKVKAAAKATGCHGLCEDGPIVSILPGGTENEKRITGDIAYYRVKPLDAKEIVRALAADETIERLLYKNNAGKTAEMWVSLIPRI